MARQYDRKHLFLRSGVPEFYKAPSAPHVPRFPERNREQHAARLRASLSALQESSREEKPRVLTIKGQAEYHLNFGPLDDARHDLQIMSQGMTKDDESYAVVRFTPKGFSKFSKKVDEYSIKNTPRGNPKNDPLMRSIEEIRKLIFDDLYYGSPDALEGDPSNERWWELWLLGGTWDKEEAKGIREGLSQAARAYDIRVDTANRIELFERQIVLVRASLNALRELVSDFTEIAEIHLPSNVVIQKFAHEGHEIANLTSLASLIVQPPSSSPSVAIIDTGVNREHPLLNNLFLDNSLGTIDPRSDSTADYWETGHGTLVAGIAGYGSLVDFIQEGSARSFEHCLESVRIEVAEDSSQKALWGNTTRRAMELLDLNRPGRNRVINLSIGAASDTSRTSWSSEIDSLAFNEGAGRIIIVAGGNINFFDYPSHDYPARNAATFLDDPSFAVNCVCVGGMTALTDILPPRPGFSTLARAGELSPFSRSGQTKGAIKPDIVCEAGNYVSDGTQNYMGEDGSSILTTNANHLERPFVNSGGTSLAAPSAARMAAIIWAQNPTLMPATIRGLLVHSASWTEAMKSQFTGNQLLRLCGYGVPDLDLARRSAGSSVTLIAEDELNLNTPEKKREIRFYSLPWPVDLLHVLGEKRIELRITLSFFGEPNSSSTARDYLGASLDWRLQHSTETDADFMKRANADRRDEGERGFTDEIDWEIGPKARSRGTVLSDRWKCTAAELASCGKIAVFPKYGWWQHKKKEHPIQRVPYSLIVSIISDDEEIELYSEIENLISVSVDV